MSSTPRAAENIATLPVSEAAVHVMTAPATSRQGDVLTCPNPTVMVSQTAGDLANVVPTFTPPVVAPPPSARTAKPTAMTMDIENADAPLSRGGLVKKEDTGISTIMFFVGIAGIVTLVGFVAVWAWGPEKNLKRTVAAAPKGEFSLNDAPTVPPVADPPPVVPPAATAAEEEPAPAAAASSAPAPQPPVRRPAKKAPKPSSRQKR